MAHLPIDLGVKAARRGHRVAFATTHDWVQKLIAEIAEASSNRN